MNFLPLLTAWSLICPVSCWPLKSWILLISCTFHQSVHYQPCGTPACSSAFPHLCTIPVMFAHLLHFPALTVHALHTPAKAWRVSIESIIVPARQQVSILPGLGIVCSAILSHILLTSRLIWNWSGFFVVWGDVNVEYRGSLMRPPLVCW